MTDQEPIRPATDEEVTAWSQSDDPTHRCASPYRSVCEGKARGEHVATCRERVVESPSYLCDECGSCGPMKVEIDGVVRCGCGSTAIVESVRCWCEGRITSSTHRVIHGPAECRVEAKPAEPQVDDVRYGPFGSCAPKPAEPEKWTGTKHDWPEDWSDENGNYHNRCVTCKSLFIGYKRRFTCKVCASPKPAEPRGGYLSDRLREAHRGDPDSVEPQGSDIELDSPDYRPPQIDALAARGFVRENRKRGSEPRPGVCRHGGLRRVCEPCDLAEQVDALEADVERLREENGGLKNALRLAMEGVLRD